MPDKIAAAFIKQYSDNVYRTLADKGYKFKDVVGHEMGRGEAKSFVETIGPTTVDILSGRHTNTQDPFDFEHDKRWVSPETYVTVAQIDDKDRFKMIINPNNAYAVGQAEAIGRKMDEVIFTALTGTSKTGKDGGTNTTLPATQNIPHGDSVLTVDKLLTTKEKLLEANNNLDTDVLTMVISPKQQTALLKSTKVGSHDYNSIRALVNGEVNRFAGFNFIIWNSLPVVHGARQCVAFLKSGIQMTTWRGVNTRIDQLPTKNYLWQLYTTASFGASRIDEQKVITVECKE